MVTRRMFLKAASGVVASGLFSFVPTQARAAKVRKILFIHGRAQQGRSSDSLKSEWIEALRKGLAERNLSLPSDVEVSFPFYGDHLDELASAGKLPLVSTIQSRGTEDEQNALAFQSSIVEEIRTAKGISDAQVLEEYGEGPRERGPENWKWVQAILRAIDKNAGGVSQSVLEAFTRDVYLYLRMGGVRDEIDEIVGRELSEEPTIVVSHSLGTIIAYRVIRADRRNLQLPLLVTVGSPLGIKTIRDQLIPLRELPKVTSWYNAYDPADVVSLYPLDQTHFPMRPIIDNFAGVKNGTENRHGISGYLSDAQVARKIGAALA